nr:SIS domain-containing protein [uncultured Thomasclavelia sp.]
MKKAKQIDVYTSAGNIYFAENFKFQMQEIGVNVNVPLEEYQQRLTASIGDKRHFAIMISFQGRGILSDILPRIIKERGSKLLLISAYDFDLKDLKPDYRLYISHHENHYKKISSYSTRLSILFILDILYTCYFETNYDDNVKKKINYYDLIDKYNK